MENKIIYVNKDDYKFIKKDLGKDFYDRDRVCRGKKKGQSAFNFVEGGYEFDIIPKNSIIKEVVSKIEFPKHLQFVVCDKAPNLPKQYKELISYWRPINKVSGTATFYQNPLNEYFLKIEDENQECIEDENGDEIVVDKDNKKVEFLTEGKVIHIQFKDLVEPDCFIKFDCNVEKTEMEEYDADIKFGEYIFYLNSNDILNSPDPLNIYMDLFRHEMLDYGYYY